MTYPTYSEWFESLSEEKKRETTRLIQQLRDVGATEPEQWARSEVSANIAQLARFMFLRKIWPECIDHWVESADAWIHRDVAESNRNPNGSFADAGRALQHLLNLGLRLGISERSLDLSLMPPYLVCSIASIAVLKSTDLKMFQVGAWKKWIHRAGPPVETWVGCMRKFFR
jgi:hypothetical protein